MERIMEENNELVSRFSEEFDVESLDTSGSKDNFYAYMKKNGMDFDDVDEVQKLPKFMIEIPKNTEMFNHFNNVLYQLNKENKISIIDSVVYITTDFLEPKAMMKLLDEMNFYLLTNELKAKYKIEKIDTGMLEFFA